MFKKSFFLILLILGLFSFLLLLLSACYHSRLVPEGPVMADTNLGGFVGGITGLNINVIDGAPPSVIQGAGLTPFSFIITLENAGEASVGPGTDNPLVFARLAGIMYKNFGLTEATVVKTLDSKLEPARRNFDGTLLPGEISSISFDNLAYKPNVFESLSLTIRAEVCYDYETYATTKFCMRRDVFEAQEDASICSLRGFKPVSNSGAPIHVTRVEEAPVNNDTVQINFVIEHLGNGVFFYRNEPKDLFDACVFDDLNPYIYKLEVFVEPVQKNTYGVDCLRLDNELSGGGAYGVIRMFQGAPLTISCFLKRTKPVSVRIYEDLLNIKLRYRYGEFLEVPILIQGHP